MITNVTMNNLFVITPYKPLWKSNPERVFANTFYLSLTWNGRNKRENTVYSSSMFSLAH